MNIQVQICGFIVCLLLMLFYLSKKRLKLYSERIFFVTLSVTLVLLFLDVFSIVACYYQDVFTKEGALLICKLYIVSLLVEVYMALLYILLDVLGERRHRMAVLVLGIITAIESLVTMLEPVYVYIEGRVMYTYGPSALCAYVFAGVDLLLAVLVNFVFKKKINPMRWFAFTLWMVIWISAAVIQFMNSRLLLVGFAVSLGMIVLFILLENPESDYNRVLGCFHSNALERYLKQLYNNRTHFVASVIMVQKADEDMGENVGYYLKSLCSDKEIFTFNNFNLDFVIISRNRESISKLETKVRKEQKNNDSIFFNAPLIHIEDGRMLDDPKTFLGFLQYMRENFRTMTSSLYYEVTPQTVEGFVGQDKVKAEIEKALEEDRVEVFLQPIYSSRRRIFSSAEALVRIRKEDDSLMSPGLFIPVAEQTGLIVELGERVFEKTCAFLKESKIRSLGIDYIEVNLSVVQCEQEELADRLIAIMERYEVEPQWINLEITETATMRAKRNLLRNMNKLIEYGVSFSLDDFGKGESNLMYVVEMPVSIVKFDYDMIKAYFSTSRAKYVVDAVTKMAHGMGLKVVAEGIETEEELQGMQEQKIDYIQGFYFSKPLPLDDFLVRVEQQ